MRQTNILLILTLAALAGGCKHATDYREMEWSADLWHQSLQIDAQREQSETQRQSSGFIFSDKLLNGLSDQFMRIYYWITGDTPFNAAKDLLDPSFPDKRRQAVMYFSKQTWGRVEPYTSYYVEMVKSDKEQLVRSIALRALNRSRVRDQTPLYIKSLEDSSELVRLEAAKALANMPDPAAMKPLIAHLRNLEENVDVRIACADALRQYKLSEAAQVLVAMLRDRNFGVAWQACWTLKLMTGHDFKYDPGKWLEYLGSAEKPFG